MILNLSVNSAGGLAPAFDSASVNAAGTEVDIVVSGAGGTLAGTWAPTGFTVTTNGHRISLASASEVNDVITLVIDTGGPIIDVETVTVSYDGTGNWSDGSNDLPPFNSSMVTNNSTVSADTTFTTDVTLTNQDYTGTSDAIVDSYAGTWTSSYEGSGTDYQYPIQFRDRGTAKTTVIGLKSYGHASLSLDWDVTYNQWSPRDNTNNIGAKDNDGLTIFRACYVNLGWDAFRVNSSTGDGTFLLEGCYVDLCRDDFIEADDNCSGTIRDCLFDGGFAGISFTTDVNSPTGKQIDCVGVLSRLEEYLYNGNVTHFGPAVKLSSDSMGWTATDCVFAIEKPDHRTDYVQLGWDKLISSSNNYLLNLSDTALSGSYPLPPAGWTVLQGSAARTKWANDKAAWLSAHGY